MPRHDKIKYSKSESGLGYVAILLLLAILSTLGFSFLFKVGANTSVTESRGAGMQAHYLAEAAANHAMWRLLNEGLPEGDYRVSHNYDDSEEDDTTAVYPEFNNPKLGDSLYIGLRFFNLPVPPGANITSAHVEFTASADESAPTDLTIQGEYADDALRFTASAGDLSGRTKTAASVSWNNIASWTKDQVYRTPDLSAIIQEIVDRPGWTGGTAMAVFFKSTLPGGARPFYAHERSPASAAQLHIEYEGGPISSDNVYHMHSLAGGRYGYKVRRHTSTTFATIATVGAVGDQVVHQSYVLYIKPIPEAPSCNAEYAEMVQPWTPQTENSWHVLDLRLGPFFVPANAVVEVAVINYSDSNERKGGVRAVGSEVDRQIKLDEAESGGKNTLVMHVQADANSQIEIFAERINEIEFLFLGYWICANYVETLVEFKAGGEALWENHDLSQYGVDAGQVAEVVITNKQGNNPNIGGVRSDGSTLDRKIDIGEIENGGVNTATLLVPAGDTGNAAIEIWAQDKGDIIFYLAGYWSMPPGTYTEMDDTLGSPSADGIWEDKDLSGFGVPAGAVAQIAMANRYADEKNRMGLRKNGSLPLRTIDLHEAVGGGGNVATMHVNTDQDSTVEWFHEDVSDGHQYLLLGYWETMDTYGTDLVGHWKLDETGGITASDSSSRGNDGSLVNIDPATGWVAGNIDGAISLDGQDEYVGVPHDSSLSLINQLTLAAWIYANPGGLDDWHIVVNKGTVGNNRNYLLGTKDDKVVFGFDDGGLKKFEEDVDLQTETWYHIAATFNHANESVRVYLDGTEVKNWGTGDQPLANNDDLTIGRSQLGEYWDGILDDVRIYNRTLSAAEILELYQTD